VLLAEGQRSDDYVGKHSESFAVFVLRRAANITRWRSVSAETSFVSVKPTDLRNLCARVRPQRFWLDRSSVSDIVSVIQGQVRITSAAPSRPSATLRLRSVEAYAGLLAPLVGSKFPNANSGGDSVSTNGDEQVREEVMTYVREKTRDLSLLGLSAQQIVAHIDGGGLKKTERELLWRIARSEAPSNGEGVGESPRRARSNS